MTLDKEIETFKITSKKRMEYWTDHAKKLRLKKYDEDDTKSSFTYSFVGGLFGFIAATAWASFQPSEIYQEEVGGLIAIMGGIAGAAVGPVVGVVVEEVGKYFISKMSDKKYSKLLKKYETILEGIDKYSTMEDLKKSKEYSSLDRLYQIVQKDIQKH